MKKSWVDASICELDVNETANGTPLTTYPDGGKYNYNGIEFDLPGGSATS